MPEVDDLAQRFPAELERLHEAVQDLSRSKGAGRAAGRA
jgi:hypothetical protein